MIMLAVAFPLTACGGDDEDKEEIINTYDLPEVTEGDTFEIIVHANGSTGYEWSYEIKPNLGIEYVSEKYVPDNDDPDAIGGGGQEIYIFKVTKTGGV